MNEKVESLSPGLSARLSVSDFCEIGRFYQFLRNTDGNFGSEVKSPKHEEKFKCL